MTLLAAPASLAGQTSALPAASPPPLPANVSGPSMAEARRALAAQENTRARALFAAILQAHPENIEARLGLADAELALKQYEAAELDFRRVVFDKPDAWSAHKNLLVVEAALGRWSEFDRERDLLRAARQRGAPGISTRESDVIESLTAGGDHWIVREYFDPVGRSRTRYNFERFTPDGRVQAYISLEQEDAAKAALHPQDVQVGAAAPAAGEPSGFILNWYTGQGHGTIARYGNTEPPYERVRADALHWMRRAPAGKPAAAPHK